MIEFIHSTYFQSLLNSFSVGVIVFNREGNIYAVNDSASSILGVDLKASLGRPWRALFGGLAELPQIRHIIEDIIAGTPPPPFSIQSTFTRDDGETRRFALSTSPLMYGNKLFGIVLEINDVSDLFNMHERERKILEEKAALQRERYEALQKLSMSVAHQIRNPAMAIGGMTKLLTRDIDPSSRKMEFAGAVNDAVKRLEDIVTAVYEYSTFRLGKPETTDIKEIVREAVRLTAAKFPAPPPVWDFRINMDTCLLNVDHAALTTALTELLVNAVESGSGRPVHGTVEGCTGAGVYTLRITDDGKGIPDENLNFIFDPFFTTKALGVGMGLCRVERIVKESGGRISVTSAPSQGTTIIIELPVS